MYATHCQMPKAKSPAFFRMSEAWWLQQSTPTYTSVVFPSSRSWSHVATRGSPDSLQSGLTAHCLAGTPNPSRLCWLQTHSFFLTSPLHLRVVRSVLRECVAELELRSTSPFWFFFSLLAFYTKEQTFFEGLQTEVLLMRHTGMQLLSFIFYD